MNSLSLTSVPAKRTNEIHAQASKVIFLGFNFDNDFVDDLNHSLKAQCPGGTVSGILTKDEVIDYFLFIVWQRRVTASGYCNLARNTASTGEAAE